MSSVSNAEEIIHEIALQKVKDTQFNAYKFAAGLKFKPNCILASVNRVISFHRWLFCLFCHLCFYVSCMMPIPHLATLVRSTNKMVLMATISDLPNVNEH